MGTKIIGVLWRWRFFLLVLWLPKIDVMLLESVWTLWLPLGAISLFIKAITCILFGSLVTVLFDLDWIISCHKNHSNSL